MNKLPKDSYELLLRYRSSGTISSQNDASKLLKDCVAFLSHIKEPFNQNYKHCPSCQSSIINATIRAYNRLNLWYKKDLL